MTEGRKISISETYGTCIKLRKYSKHFEWYRIWKWQPYELNITHNRIICFRNSVIYFEHPAWSYVINWLDQSIIIRNYIIFLKCFQIFTTIYISVFPYMCDNTFKFICRRKWWRESGRVQRGWRRGKLNSSKKKKRENQEIFEHVFWTCDSFNRIWTQVIFWNTMKYSSRFDWSHKLSDLSL